ncbi:UdgX family uracil-DNA binding protein [Oceaniglobus roseus]|uniref:UdgX family uracil-DNA binding protein n=1 Tax=Oceaniglobus roseus TaxID=1737570 RepID=UPI000C7EBE61|nr:UdgX family uracil-DNA binding protein [Kandeliimicrobium roseum]
MPTVTLPTIGTEAAFRDAARAQAAAGVPPEALSWHFCSAAPDLFADPAPAPTSGAALTVPKSFVELMRAVVWHADPERFARLYALLWRLRDRPKLMEDRADPALARLRQMEKAVRRDKHKMTAFVRFRELEATGPRRRFAAWFEPSHYTLEPTAPFFAKRFGDMDWVIQTPHLTAHFENGEIRFAEGASKPPLPEDATEELWRTYFSNIFNPARLKVSAMTSEMPKKYWKNLPEAELIPGLIASAQSRARAMEAAAPTLPPVFSDRILAMPKAPDTRPELHRQLAACTRCPLYKDATQAVPGEGPLDAALMIVAEQPGDNEDLAGRPLVGPAGQLFDRIAEEAGLERPAAFVTNAVKHFKFTPRGKRRIHQKPDAGEVEACKWWLEAERQLVKPKLILALGATAAASLTGTGKGITRRRGSVEQTEDGTPVYLSVHPSYLLRLPDAALREAETERFREDLRRVAEMVRGAA